MSNQIFDHFFLNGFDNAKRWNFIEDFFLGEDIDILFDNYQSNQPNNINIVDHLKKNAALNTVVNIGEDMDNSIHIFKANKEIYYKMDNLLTIESDGTKKTMKVNEWLKHDPISFHKEKILHKFNIDKTVFELLGNKLKLNHPEYYKKILGLSLKIEFKGYEKAVKASVPYNNKPIDFYKWWCDNQDTVSLSNIDKIKLFDIVNNTNAKVLKAEHLAVIKK